MTSSKLSELKELRLKCNDGARKYPHKFSEEDALFYKTAINSWLTLIECLESATELLQEQIDFGYDQTNHLADGLAEIESKLGGMG